MRLRKFTPQDLPEIYDLYRAQAALLTDSPAVRRNQFERDLFTARMTRNPADHHPKAKTSWVAIDGKNRVRAFVSGGIATTGDIVIAPRTGYIQAIIAEPTARDATARLVAKVVSHLKRYRPASIVAFDGRLSPVFADLGACCLPSAWAWIGQVLTDGGFEIAGQSLRMTRALVSKRLPEAPKLPRGWRFHHCTHGMFGFENAHDFGCVLLRPPGGEDDGVVWCGNFYSGAFVKGSGHRALYINWFTVIDEADLGKGYGRLTLQHVLREAQAKGARSATLLTDRTNFIAQNLYASEGFAVADVVSAFSYK